MKIKKRILPLLALLLLFFQKGKAEDNNPYEILKALVSAQKINTKFPIIDSLFPIQTNKISGDILGVLNKKERKELKRATKNKKGFKLNPDSLKGITLIPAIPIFEALAKFDSTSAKLIDENQPFYMASAPIFFHNNSKAIINLSLIKGFGSSYIFEKRGDNWVLVKEIYGWMS